MPTDVEISRAHIDDAKAILALQKLAYQCEARLYQNWSIPPLTQMLDDVRGEFQTKTFLKAVCDQVIIGSVRAACDHLTCEIGRLIVHPDHQRKSVGSRLMQAIEAFFPDVERFRLFTGERSDGNLRLYARLGYRVTHVEALSPRLTIVHLEKQR